MKLKEWPTNKTASYEDVMTPVRKALDVILERGKDSTETVPYDGYGFFSPQILACLPNADEMFHHDGLEYHKERGRDALDALLHVTYLLGMESGRLQERFDEGKAARLNLIAMELENAQTLLRELLLENKDERENADTSTEHEEKRA